MNCQKARECFAELLDPRTPPTAELEARAHLASCPDCQRDFASLTQTLSALDSLPVEPPSSKLRRDFYAMLEEEKHSAASARAVADREHHVRIRRWIQWGLAPIAATAFATAGYLVGVRDQTGPTQNVARATEEMKQELHSLRAKVDQMDAMNQLVAASLQGQQRRSASDRLQGVLTSASINHPNEQVINELITSLALDPSANVRLRALEALYPHANLDVVRAAVLASLPRETSPLVQVAMIDFLAAARDRDAKSALEKMSVNVAIDQSVRTAAKRALAQL